MKLFLALTLLGIACGLQSFESFEANAINLIIKQHFTKRVKNFEVMFEKEDSKKIADIANELMRKCKFPLKTRQIIQGHEKILIQESAVLLFENMNSYRQFHNRTDHNLCPKSLFFLVFIVNFDRSKLVFKAATTFLSEYFIVRQDDHYLSLITFKQFEPPKCRRWVEVEVNQYSKHRMQWQSDKFHLEKFKDYNGCDLVIGAAPHVHDVYIEFDGNNKLTKIWGQAIEINNIISAALNYSIHYNIINLPKTLKYSNQSLHYDILLFIYAIKRINYSEEVITTPFRMNAELIAIPPDEMYSQFEKLFLPFEIQVWIWLIVTMSTAVATIIVINFTPKKVKDFVFGFKVKTPILNLM